MKGIPKGSQPFGRVQRQRLWQGLGQRPKYNKALRKGEFRKQSSELFSEEGRPASEGVPHYRSLIVLTSFRADNLPTGAATLCPSDISLYYRESPPLLAFIDLAFVFFTFGVFKVGLVLYHRMPHTDYQCHGNDGCEP